jgi:hypothetical protein
MLPSLGGAATAPLPPERSATGTALYAMCRQIGLALGVSCLVAVLGTASGAAAVHAFRHAWIFMAICSVASGLILQGIPRKVRIRHQSVEAFVEERQAFALAAGK